MLFVDTNSHLTTKPHNCYIKCQSNSQSYEWHNFLGTKFRGGQDFFYLWWKVFSTRESTLALTAWTFLWESIRVFIVEETQGPPVWEPQLYRRSRSRPRSQRWRREVRPGEGVLGFTNYTVEIFIIMYGKYLNKLKFYSIRRILNSTIVLKALVWFKNNQLF